MARSVPVDFNDKRRILYGKSQEKAIHRTASDFLEAGRLSEALEFLERSREGALLQKVRAAAIERGDAFALSRCLQLMGDAGDPAEWNALAARAEATDRWYDAIRALERSGNTERSEALRMERHPDYRPFKPAGK
jgi:hypothetical protein